jgi:hypothetical protein
MIVGHTKFSPDRFFGTVKLDYNKNNVYTFEHVVKLYQKPKNSNVSTTNNTYN